jgi:hypothetical protein
LRQTTWPQIEVHRDYIAGMLAAGVTQATIWQRLCDEQGLAAGVASLKRWVAANLPEETRRGRVTVLADDPAPGSQAQIDYGHLGSWVDPRWDCCIQRDLAGVGLEEAQVTRPVGVH